MPESSPHIPARPSRGRRIPFLVSGAIAGVVAIGLMLAGGAVLWANGKKDDHGYISTKTHTFAAPTSALATENVDADFDGAGWLVDSGDFGKVRLKVASSKDKPVFVGIARTSDVSAYLRDVSHTTVKDLDYGPFKVDYRDHGGHRQATRPADRHIWAASAQGEGTQTLTWGVKDGSWSVVVMNADGSPGVRAGISAGANVPFLEPLGWTVLGGGVILFATAAGLIVIGLRPPRSRPGSAAVGPEAVVPAAG
jgi:hypothetical protein